MASTQFHSIYESAIDSVDYKMNQLDWESPLTYANWLAQSYYFVCHSTRLLGAQMSHISVANSQLHRRIAQHIREEGGHEILALRDLQALGQNINDYPELGLTKVFYGFQYYGIDRVSPMGLLGYILFLEGLAIEVGPTILARLQRAYGTKSTQFLRVHTEEDVSHVKKALEEIDRLSPEEQEIVTDNLMVSLQIYNLILNEINLNKDLSVAQTARC